MRISSIVYPHLWLLLVVLVFSGALLASDAGHATHIDVLKPDGSPAQQQGPDTIFTHLLFWEWLAFAILFIIVAKVALPGMFKALNARQTKIEHALETAEKVKVEAETLLKRHEKMMAESHAEAKRITDEAIAAANKARDEIILASKKQSASIAEHAKQEIRLAQNKAMADLRTQAVELSLMASSAVLGEKLAAPDHRKLAEQAIERAASSLSTKN